MANLFIPVGRRFNNTRSELAARLEYGTVDYNGVTITWVDFGYAGDDECIAVATPAGMRYHARSALMRPGTAYDRVVVVDSNSWVGVGGEPSSSYDPMTNNLIELQSDGGGHAALTMQGTLFGIWKNMYHDGTNYRRHQIGESSAILMGSNYVIVYTAPTGPANEIAAVVNRLDVGLTSTRFNASKGNYDFEVHGQNVDNLILVDADADTVHLGNSHVNIDNTNGLVSIGKAVVGSTPLAIALPADDLELLDFNASETTVFTTRHGSIIIRLPGTTLLGRIMVYDVST